jgi:hypothetical protein
MTKKEKEQAVITFVAALLANEGAGDMSAHLTSAMDYADALDKKLKGETEDDSDDDDLSADDDSDSEDDDGDSEDENEDSDSDSEGDEGNDEDDAEEDGDDEAEDDEDPPGKKGKKPSKKSPPSTAGKKTGKATAKPAPKGKKSFKKKPQSYARDNDTHKEIFSGVLKAVKPDWKKDAASKKRAKEISVKLEGDDFLDENGNVLVSFKQSVKKFMLAKK